MANKTTKEEAITYLSISNIDKANKIEKLEKALKDKVKEAEELLGYIQELAVFMNTDKWSHPHNITNGIIRRLKDVEKV